MKSIAAAVTTIVCLAIVPGCATATGGGGSGATPQPDDSSTSDSTSSGDPNGGPTEPAYQAAAWTRCGGPPGGLGYDIRYDFDDHERWYVTDANAGFFYSQDRGLTWQASNEGFVPLEANQANVPVFSATVDPHDPTIIWVGLQLTGHIYKSVDRGMSWTRKDNGVTPNVGLSFRGFTVHPDSSDIVYAAAEVEAYVFRDAGIMPDARDETQGGRVYRTEDGGENWNLIWGNTSAVCNASRGWRMLR